MKIFIIFCFTLLLIGCTTPQPTTQETKLSTTTETPEAPTDLGSIIYEESQEDLRELSIIEQ